VAFGECQAVKIHGANSQTYSTGFTTQMLDQQVYFAVVHQEVTRRHLTVSDADVKSVEQQLVSSIPQQCPGISDGQAVLDKLGAYKDVVLRGYADRVALEQYFEKSLSTDTGLRNLYEKTKDQYKGLSCVSVIEVATKPAATQDASGKVIPAPESAFATALTKAQQLQARLANGESFASVAKSSSDETSSASQGGVLGCAKKGSFTSSGFPELDAAAFDQPVGQAGAPIRTSLGYIILKVTARGDLTFEQAKDLVKQNIPNTAQSLFVDYLTSVSRGVRVVVDPQWGSWDGKLGFVQAPVAATSTTLVPRPRATTSTSTTNPSP
jgi:hypothetical protein